MLNGTISGLNAAVYLGNGLAEGQFLTSGQQYKDNNANKGLGGKLGWKIGQQFEVAYSHYRGRYDEDNSRNLVLHGANVFWVTKDFQIFSEYTKAEFENPEGYAKGDAKGYFVQVSTSMFGIKPVVSYQWYKYEDEFHGYDFFGPEHPGNGFFDEKTRWTLGLTFHILKKPVGFEGPTYTYDNFNALIKFEYQLNGEKGDNIKDDVILLQAALSF